MNSLDNAGSAKSQRCKSIREIQDRYGSIADDLLRRFQTADPTVELFAEEAIKVILFNVQATVGVFRIRTRSQTVKYRFTS